MFVYINLLNLLYFYIKLNLNIAQQNTRYEQRGEKNRKLSDSAPRHNIEPVTGSDDEVVQPARNRRGEFPFTLSIYRSVSLTTSVSPT